MPLKMDESWAKFVVELHLSHSLRYSTQLFSAKTPFLSFSMFVLKSANLSNTKVIVLSALAPSSWSDDQLE
jgi:hypothetical protein